MLIKTEKKNRISENIGARKMVSMETSKLVITWYKYQNISRRLLEKVAKFGGESFNRHEVIHLQSRRGPQKPPLRSEYAKVLKMY